MIVRTLVVSSVLLLNAPPEVLGQARSEDPRSDYNVHMGAFYLKSGVNLKEFGIDTNVFNEPDRGRKDFTFTVTPQLTTSVPLASRGLLQLFTAADVVYYQKYDSERSINPNLSMRGEVYFNRVTLFAEPSYLRTRERPSLEIDKRSQRVEQGTATGVEVGILPKLTFESALEHVRTAYDADEFFLGTNLAEVLNRHGWTLSGTTKWQATPLTTFVLKGDVLRDRFSSSPSRDADSVRFTGGVELKPRALISGRAHIGVRKFQPVDPTRTPYTGVVASAALSYILGGSTTLGMRANRDVHYSFEPLQPYYVGTGWGAHLQRHLVGRFDAFAGIDRFRNSSQMFEPTENGDATDVTDTYDANIGYRISKTGRLAVGLAYWVRKSERDDSRNYKGIRFRTSLTYGL